MHAIRGGYVLSHSAIEDYMCLLGLPIGIFTAVVIVGLLAEYWRTRND